MRMPEPDAALIARRAEIAAALRRIVPGEGVIVAEDERRAYESDGLTAYRQPPLVVVLPSTVAAGRGGAALLPGARRSRSCRAAPAPRCRAARCRWPTASCSAWASSTASSRSITTTAAPWCSPASPISASPTRSQHAGFYYAPDPSSQIACTIGGNVAENSGGVHCLKYGLTTNNVLGIEMVLIDGEVMRLGGKHLDAEGYDLLGVMTGSEGLLGVVTEVTVRILPKPTTARALLIGFPSERGAPAIASPRSSAPASSRAAWR